MSIKESVSPSEDRDPIDLLADSFVARFRAGERPSIDEYALKYPDLAEEIRAILPALVELELNQSPGGTSTGTAQSPLGECAGAAFNLSIHDNDGAGDRLERFAILWSNDPSSTPFFQGENAWAVDLHLARPLKYELVAGPKGASLDPDTGVFTWNTPNEPQTAKATVRIRDAEKPDLNVLTNFTITTTAK